MTKGKRPQDWTAEERLNVVIACGSLAGDAINQLCREKDISPHHIKQWKNDFIKSNTMADKPKKQSDDKQFKNEINALQKELNRKNKVLAETAALLVLKKSQCYLGKQRGQLIMTQERDKIICLINEVRANGARQKQACVIIGITPRTLQRWSQAEKKGDGRLSPKHSPINKFSEVERQRIIHICKQPEYANLQLVALC